jgi:hypothetical protein
MNTPVKELMPRMTGSVHCNYGPCQCIVSMKGLYCSEYCRQAAAQGVERDYCQCEHRHEETRSFCSVDIAPVWTASMEGDYIRGA